MEYKDYGRVVKELKSFFEPLIGVGLKRPLPILVELTQLTRCSNWVSNTFSVSMGASSRDGSTEIREPCSYSILTWFRKC
jgi:hypothetical protein